MSWTYAPIPLHILADACEPGLPAKRVALWSRCLSRALLGLRHDSTRWLEQHLDV